MINLCMPAAMTINLCYFAVSVGQDTIVTGATTVFTLVH